MDAWVTLLAAVAGAAIALVGQYLTKRGENRTRGGELLLEQCSQLVALNEDFRNRVWEERVLGREGRVDGWDLTSSRLASARLRLLCDDQTVLLALDELNSSGGQLGSYWRRGQVEPQEFERRYERFKAAVDGFISASANLIRRRLGGP